MEVREKERIENEIVDLIVEKGQLLWNIHIMERQVKEKQELIDKFTEKLNDNPTP